jgi:hypothetical protein
LTETASPCSSETMNIASDAGPWWRRPVLDWMLLACIALGAVYRIVALGHLPGINGDEAYLGTKAMMSMSGGEISLRTGSGLLADPFSLTLSWIVHALFGVSFWTLRLPVVICGILTIAVIFIVARQIWGPKVALTCAALASALPTHIVYSRFFWEPSQSPLVCTLWLYAAMTRRIWLVLLLGCLAAVVHPTNAFMLPIVVSPFLQFAEVRAWLGTRSRTRRLAVKIGVLVCIGASLILVLLLYGKNPQFVDRLRGAQDRVTSAANWWEFATKYPGLMDGSTMYEYIVGPLSARARTLHRLGFVLLWAVPVVLSLCLGNRKLLYFVGSLVVSLVIFFAIAGPGAVSPNSERYALWMTVPHLLIGAIAWEHIAQRLQRPWTAHATAWLVCCALLASFSVQYFHRLHVSNSVTENAFATADVEPKQQAFALIEKHVQQDGLPRILAEDWWTYWALKYLSLGSHKAHYEVSILDTNWDTRFPRDFTLAPKPVNSANVFLVGYVGGALDGAVQSRWPMMQRKVISGYGARPVLAVFGLGL